MSSAPRRSPASASSAANLSIGEVLGQLREEFADVSISKIRYLEAEGLVEPARTPSGYRKFSQDDVERLRYILTVQRDHFWPLRVIREALDAYDRGFDPPGTAAGAPRPRAPRVVPDGLPDSASFGRRGQGLRMTRSELAVAAGLDESDVGQLETFGLLTRGGGRVLRRDRADHRPRGRRAGGVRDRAPSPAHVPHRRRPGGRPGRAGRHAAGPRSRRRRAGARERGGAGDLGSLRPAARRTGQGRPRPTSRLAVGRWARSTGRRCPGLR